MTLERRYACPRKGCHLVTDRLVELIVIERSAVSDRVVQHPPQYVCVECHEDLVYQARQDPGMAITLTGRALVSIAQGAVRRGGQIESTGVSTRDDPGGNPSTEPRELRVPGGPLP